MNEITLVEIGYNCYNGITIEFIAIEVGNFEGALLGLNFGKGFLNFDILFFHFEVKSLVY